MRLQSGRGEGGGGEMRSLTNPAGVSFLLLQRSQRTVSASPFPFLSMFSFLSSQEALCFCLDGSLPMTHPLSGVREQLFC